MRELPKRIPRIGQVEKGGPVMDILQHWKVKSLGAERTWSYTSKKKSKII